MFSPLISNKVLSLLGPSAPKIFKILEADSLGFVQEYWDESFLRINTETNDWVLELNTDPDGNKLEKILALKNVEEYNA